MKKFLLMAPLFFSCVTSPEMIPMRDPVVRTVERVLDRHDTFVMDDESLTPAEEEDAMMESMASRALIALEEAPGSVMLDVMGPVMDRHDAYVQSLVADELDQRIMLRDTERLRSLFGSVPALEEVR